MQAARPPRANVWRLALFPVSHKHYPLTLVAFNVRGAVGQRGPERWQLAAGGVVTQKAADLQGAALCSKTSIIEIGGDRKVMAIV